MSWACRRPDRGHRHVHRHLARPPRGQPVVAASSAQASQRAHSRGPYSANGRELPPPRRPSISAPSRTVMPRNRVRIGMANARSRAAGPPPCQPARARSLVQGAGRTRGALPAGGWCCPLLVRLPCHSVTRCPPDRCLICPINLTSVIAPAFARGAAAGLPRRRAAAGGAVVRPGRHRARDPAARSRACRSRLAALLGAFAPDAIETAGGITALPPPARRPPRAPGVDPEVAVVIATSGSTGRRRAPSCPPPRCWPRPAAAGPDRRPARRPLAVLPAASHIAGLAGAGPVAARRDRAPVVTDRLHPGGPGRGRGCALRVTGPDPAAPAGRTPGPTWPCCAPSCSAAPPSPAGPAGRRAGGGRAGGHHLRDERDLRRLRLRRCPAGRRAGADRARTAGSGSPARCCSPATGCAPT